MARVTLVLIGGEGEIRTHEPRKGPPVFKTGAFNRSATSPYNLILPDLAWPRVAPRAVLCAMDRAWPILRTLGGPENSCLACDSGPRQVKGKC